jgi:hypothetical protein
LSGSQRNEQIESRGKCARGQEVGRFVLVVYIRQPLVKSPRNHGKRADAAHCWRGVSDPHGRGTSCKAIGFLTADCNPHDGLLSGQSHDTMNIRQAE